MRLASAGSLRGTLKIKLLMSWYKAFDVTFLLPPPPHFSLLFGDLFLFFSGNVTAGSRRWLQIPSPACTLLPHHSDAEVLKADLKYTEENEKLCKSFPKPQIRP